MGREKLQGQKNKSKHIHTALNTHSKRNNSAHNQDLSRRLSRDAPRKTPARNKSQTSKFTEFSAKSVDEYIAENAIKSTEIQGGYLTDNLSEYSLDNSSDNNYKDVYMSDISEGNISSENPNNSGGNRSIHNDFNLRDTEQELTQTHNSFRDNYTYSPGNSERKRNTARFIEHSAKTFESPQYDSNPQIPQPFAEKPKFYEPMTVSNQGEKPSVLSHEESLNSLSARQSKARFGAGVAAAVNTAAVPASVTASPANNRKLQFSADEIAPDKSDLADKSDRKINKLKSKAEHSGNKLETARGELPTKKQIKKRIVYDEQKGKAKKKLVFEEQIKSQKEHL